MMALSRNVALSLLLVLGITLQINGTSLGQSGLTVTVWYGDEQTFGQPGNPQAWVNILGNVTPSNELSALTYSLNGGPVRALNWGTTAVTTQHPSQASPLARTAVQAGNPRLVSPGDFNIEIAVQDLQSGANTVRITATNPSQNETVKEVTVNYVTGQTWPIPFVVDWSQVSSISDVAQVVDGEWTIGPDGLRTAVAGYDRVVAIGDLAWTNYEVTVPITVHGYPLQNAYSGEFGVATRWQGHLRTNPAEQPTTGWWNIGGYGLYRSWSPQKSFVLLRGNDWPGTSTPTPALALNTPYTFKIRVQTKQPGGPGFYSFKVWPTGTAEPAQWIFEEYDIPNYANKNGSVLLVAHEVDVSFGTLVVEPIVGLSTSVIGEGTIAATPALETASDAYFYGDTVTLQANPADGWTFAGWESDVASDANPISVQLLQDTTIAARFEKNGYTVSVQTAGNGTITRDPDKTLYDEGETVTLTADPAAGWTFAGWSGDATGMANPTAVSVTKDLAITATFEQESYTVAVSTSGSGQVQVSPARASYGYGEEVTLTALPDPGWLFAGWSGDVVSDENPETVTITQTLFIDANFVVNQPPVITITGSTTTTPGATMTLQIAAADANGTTPVIRVPDAPPAAAFVDFGDGTARFDWLPTAADLGRTTVTITADDGAQQAALPLQLLVRAAPVYVPMIVAAPN